MLLAGLQQPHHDLQLIERHRLRSWPAHAAPLRPRRPGNVRVFDFEDEAVLVRDQDSHHLNASAYVVWQCCDGATELAQIAAELAATFDIDPSTAIDHVEQIVARLAESGLIEDGTDPEPDAPAVSPDGATSRVQQDGMQVPHPVHGSVTRCDPAMSSRCYSLGEVHLNLTCDEPKLESEFLRIYSRYPESRHSGETFAMQVRRRGRRLTLRPRFEILGDGEVIGPPRTRDEVVPAMEWAVNSRVIARRSEFLQIHAASMVHPAGFAVLFVGTSGCGKSTLAAALLRRGWKYLCDEFALLDPDTLHAHPFPKPLCVKEHGFEVIRQIGLQFAGVSHYVKGIKGRVAYIHPHTVCSDPVGGPAPVRFIVFPQYARTAPRMIEISRARAMFGMAGGLLNRTQFGPRAHHVLHALAGKSECFAMRSGELTATCDLLESTLSNRGPQGWGL